MRLVIVLWLGLLVAPVFAQEAVDATVRKLPNVFYAAFGDFEVRTEVTTPIVYLPGGQPATFFRFAEPLCKYKGEVLDESSGFVNIGGRAVEVAVSAADENVHIKPNPEIGNRYTFKKAGDTALLVKIGVNSIRIPIRVIELPRLRVGMSSRDLIKLLGLPTHKEPIYVGWPDLETYDDIIYNPDAGSPDFGEHWRFRKLMHAVFVIRAEKVTNIHSCAKVDELAATDELLLWATGTGL